MVIIYLKFRRAPYRDPTVSQPTLTDQRKPQRETRVEEARGMQTVLRHSFPFAICKGLSYLTACPFYRITFVPFHSSKNHPTSRLDIMLGQWAKLQKRKLLCHPLPYQLASHVIIIFLSFSFFIFFFWNTRFGRPCENPIFCPSWFCNKTELNNIMFEQSGGTQPRWWAWWWWWLKNDNKSRWQISS